MGKGNARAGVHRGFCSCKDAIPNGPPWRTMDSVTGIRELDAQLAALSITEARGVADQLRGVLDSLPTDESSYADKGLRNGLEMFLAGYDMGTSGRTGNDPT